MIEERVIPCSTPPRGKENLQQRLAFGGRRHDQRHR